MVGIDRYFLDLIGHIWSAISLKEELMVLSLSISSSYWEENANGFR